MRIKSFLTSVAVAALLPASAMAAPIGIADFSAPIIEEFEGLGLPFITPAPLILNGVTYTSNDGQFRYFANTDAFPNCFGGCLTTQTFAPGFIDVVFDVAFQKVGAFLGAAAVPNSATAEFFDQNDTLVGTVSFTGLAAGDEFVGFEDVAGIKRVRFTDTADQGFVLSLDRLHRESVVPEPGTLALLGLSLAGLAATRRRKQ